MGRGSTSEHGSILDIEQKNCIPVALDSGIDYRIQKGAAKTSFYLMWVPLLQQVYKLIQNWFPFPALDFRKSECDADAELNRMFKVLASQENDGESNSRIEPKNLKVSGEVFFCSHSAAHSHNQGAQRGVCQSLWTSARLFLLRAVWPRKFTRCVAVSAAIWACYPFSGNEW